MKLKSSLLLFLMVILVVPSCKETATREGVVVAEQASTLNDTNTSETSDKQFNEGVITIEIAYPNNPYGKMLSKIDPEKGDLEQQMVQIGKEMTTEEQQEIQQYSEKAGLFLIAFIMTPFESHLYFKENEILAKAKAFSYYLENYQNSESDEGFFHVASNNSQESVTAKYIPSQTSKTWQTVEISNDDYDREQDGTEVVAGYTCQRSIYTLKNEPEMIMGMSSTPLKLEVFTSQRMPKDLNFHHSYYIPEENGILKIIASFDEENEKQIEYKATVIEHKTVSADDLAVTKTEPIYDYEEDVMALGFKLLGIMMGGGMDDSGE